MFIPIAFTVQISNITSNGHSPGHPIIYMDTIHITSNDHSFAVQSSTWTLFTLLAMIAYSAAQSSTWTLFTMLLFT